MLINYIYYIILFNKYDFINFIYDFNYYIYYNFYNMLLYYNTHIIYNYCYKKYNFHDDHIFYILHKNLFNCIYYILSFNKYDYNCVLNYNIFYIYYNMNMNCIIYIINIHNYTAFYIIYY